MYCLSVCSLLLLLYKDFLMHWCMAGLEKTLYREGRRGMTFVRAWWIPTVTNILMIVTSTVVVVLQIARTLIGTPTARGHHLLDHRPQVEGQW